MPILFVPKSRIFMLVAVSLFEYKFLLTDFSIVLYDVCLFLHCFVGGVVWYWSTSGEAEFTPQGFLYCEKWKSIYSCHIFSVWIHRCCLCKIVLCLYLFRVLTLVFSTCDAHFFFFFSSKGMLPHKFILIDIGYETSVEWWSIVFIYNLYAFLLFYFCNGL